MKTRKQETACGTDCRSIGEVDHASQSWAEFICHCSDCLPPSRRCVQVRTARRADESLALQ